MGVKIPPRDLSNANILANVSLQDDVHANAVRQARANIIEEHANAERLARAKMIEEIVHPSNYILKYRRIHINF